MLRREICVDFRRQLIRELAFAIISAGVIFGAAVGVVWLVQLLLGAASQGG